MKKIMFNDRYELTEAVLSGQKTQTRRIIPNCPGVRESLFCKSGIEDIHGYELKPRFHVGEVVAVAQSYKEAGIHSLPCEDEEFGCYSFPAEQTQGWTNKMFVRADLMPHHIRITNARVERLQEISDEDCLKEGIIHAWTGSDGVKIYHSPNAHERRGYVSADDPRYAFAFFIDRILGKGTWASNPYVFVYDFELIK